MEKNQVFGVLGAAMLLVGVFLPIMDFPPVTHSFFGRGDMIGWLVFLLAVAAFVLALKQEFRALLGLAMVVSAVVLYEFYGTWDTVTVVNHAMTTLQRAGSTEIYTRPELAFGWGVLFAGIAFLFAASAVEARAVWVRLCSAWKAHV